MIKSRNIFQNDDVYETVETESGSESGPPHTPAVTVREKVSEWKLSEEARERGPGGLVTFTFSQPSEPSALQWAITLSKYFWLRPPEKHKNPNLLLGQLTCLDLLAIINS